MLKGPHIVNRIKALVKERRTKTTVLGVILGSKESSSPQAKCHKYASFLKNTHIGKLNLNELERLASYFEKPIDYFVCPSPESMWYNKRKIIEGEKGSYIFIHQNDRDVLEGVLSSIASSAIES